MKREKPGKIFENDFKKSCPFWIEREKDNVSSFNKGNDVIKFTMSNDYDFRFFTGKKLFLVELKSTLGKSLPFSKIKTTIDKKTGKIKYDQLKRLVEHAEYKNVITGVIINYREKNNYTFFIEARVLLYLRDNFPSKSISIDDCIKYGHSIINGLVQSHYRYIFNVFEKM
jgi:penicillin-binding protein-related factor A (putative recombinase)